MSIRRIEPLKIQWFHLFEDSSRFERSVRCGSNWMLDLNSTGEPLI